MKIFTRLLLLVGSTALLFALAAAVYVAALSPIETIQAEHQYFVAAERAATELEVQVGRLLTESFGNQKPVYRAAAADYYAAIDELAAKVKYLPRYSADMTEAVAAVQKLKAVSAQNLEALDGNLKDLEGDADAVFADVPSAYVMKFFGPSAKSAKPELVAAAQSHVFDLQNTMQNLDSFLSATAQTIHDKEQAVAAEIAKVRNGSMRFIAVVAVLIVAAAFLLAFFMARRIVKSLKYLMDHLTDMAGGDLGFRFAVGSRDEIGMLGRDLNLMLETLTASVSQIQEAARQNLAIRNELVQAVNEATSSAVEIEANSNSISRQMERMDQTIETSRQDLERVVELIDGFNQRMDAQNRSVADSVAAVTQILASIDNIAHVTELNQEATGNLVQESDRGRAVFEEAFSRVTEISESVAAIQEMATVIAGVATQTNILAMNAAIEAAHAGEYGKGFAVVADEISKLAAASAASSDEIAQTIQDVVGKFQEAADTKESTIAAFDLIGSRIKSVNNSVDEIYSNVKEMRAGSRQVLESTQELRDSSAQITRESGKIKADVDGIKGIFQEVGRVSREVVSNIAEISIGLHDITREVHLVSDRAGQLEEVGGKLDRAVDQFKTAAAD